MDDEDQTAELPPEEMTVRITLVNDIFGGANFNRGEE